jgi:serine/threonine protein kinase
VMQFKEFNEKADVYSFGIVLWELLTRKEPFAHHNNYSKFRKAVCQKHERPEIPEDTEPSLRTLIEQCWAPDPNKRPSFKQIISHLDNVIIDVAVKDKIGRHIWQTKFLSRDDVPWGEFQDALIEALKLPMADPQHKERLELNFKCLKALLAAQPKAQTTTKKSECVSLRNWGKILQWFGPIKVPDVTATQSQQHVTFMDDITNILRQPWFHGDTDLQRAQELLSGKPAGTFMIRFSSLEGWYTISQIHGRIIQHQRIGHQPGEPFVIENDSYGSLFELVEQRGLIQPCDGSRYTLLFQPDDPSGYPCYFNSYKT